MNNDWVGDIEEMHDKYHVMQWVNKQLAQGDFDSIEEFMKFLMKFLDEEHAETKKAVENKDAEEVVDGLIDLCVVAIGTLDAFGIDARAAWNEVFRANMEKEIGVKESRPNPLGLPDLVKPDGWNAPSHKSNHGLLRRMWDVRSDNI